MQDISIDSDKIPKTQDTEKLEGGKDSVMRKLLCTKCPEMFFTREGYQRHLFKDHKVRCFEKHPAQVIEKIVMRCSEDTYETKYRVIDTKISDKGDDAEPNTETHVKQIDSPEKESADGNVEEEGTVTMNSGEESRSKENNQNIENVIVKSDGPSKKNRKGKKPRGKKSHLTRRKKITVIEQGDKDESESFEQLQKAIQNVYVFNKETPTVKCIGCETYFYSEEGMKTHFKNAHTNLMGNKDSVRNDCETDERFNEAPTLTNGPDTAESELPDVVPPAQTVTCGRKRSRNQCDTSVSNKKHSRGSPSPSTKLEKKVKSKSVDEKKEGTQRNADLKLRRNKSNISDNSTASDIHFTRSQKSEIKVTDEAVPRESVMQSKRKSSSKDFNTKAIPEEKKKKQVDAIDIVEKHTKKTVDENVAESKNGTVQSSKNSDRKEYATRSKGNVPWPHRQEILIVDKSDKVTIDGKQMKSADMTLKDKNRKNKQSTTGSDNSRQAVTVPSKDIDKPTKKRNKRQISEISDDSSNITMSAADTVTAPKKQKRNRYKSGISDNTAKPSKSSGSVPAQSEGGRTTRQTSKKSDTDKSTANDAPTKVNSASGQDGFSCHICQQMFRNYDELKIHKVKCTKNPKKHFCSVCGKGFHARTLMQQHYDFRHTSKLKRFVCTECNKAFELKKSFDEHMMRLHNKGDYKFQCDFCGRRFFHLQEFKVHRAKHTNIKEYSCGRCNNAAFATPGKLNAHLANCGKPSMHECTICHKFYSTSSNLAIHVGDVHKNEVTWTCPICPNKVYGSQGGYYHHLRYQHKIGRNGDKLEDYIAKNILKPKRKSPNKKRKNNEETNDDNEDNDNGSDE